MDKNLFLYKFVILIFLPLGICLSALANNQEIAIKNQQLNNSQETQETIEEAIEESLKQAEGEQQIIQDLDLLADLDLLLDLEFLENLEELELMENENQTGEVENEKE